MPSFSLPSMTFPLYLTRPPSFRRKSSASASNSSSPPASSPAAPAVQKPVHVPLLHHASLEYLVSADGFQRTGQTPLGSPSSLADAPSSRLRCTRCLADLAHTSQIISKGFTGRHGRAYLVAPASTTSSSPYALLETPCVTTPGGVPVHAAGQQQQQLPNTFVHRAVPRHLVTGMHTVGDISCALCGAVLGWKYVAAEDEAQRYKVGKFILEARRVVVWGEWDGATVEEGGPVGGTVEKVGRRASVGAVGDEIEFDSQDDGECEDLFLGVWTPQSALRRRRARRAGLSQYSLGRA